jgi:hypothetical protein
VTVKITDVTATDFARLLVAEALHSQEEESLYMNSPPPAATD